MKKLLAILLCMGTVFHCIAQSEYNDAKFVMGIEVAKNYYTFSGNHRIPFDFVIGYNFEYPIRKFSYGFGLQWKNYGNVQYEEYTGNSRLRRDSRGEWTPLYEYRNAFFQLNYIVLSNRLEYRLPCNCVFLHVGHNTELLGWRTEKLADAYVKETGFEPYDLEEILDLRDLNMGIEFGIGFKAHLTEMTRITMRQNFVWNASPSKTINRFYDRNLDFLQVYFSIQRGFK